MRELETLALHDTVDLYVGFLKCTDDVQQRALCREVTYEISNVRTA